MNYSESTKVIFYTFWFREKNTPVENTIERYSYLWGKCSFVHNILNGCIRKFNMKVTDLWYAIRSS